MTSATQKPSIARRSFADPSAVGHAQAAVPVRGDPPIGIDLQRGLRWVRRTATRAAAFVVVTAVLLAAVSVATWWTQPKRPAFYHAESPLRLSGLGSGLTETFRLAGGEQQVAWSALTEWGCRFRADLIPAGGEAPIPLADAPVATTAVGMVGLRGVTPGEYALRADSSCAWTVTFGPN